MLAIFPKAVYFAALADRAGIDHLCSFWANHCATAAYIMAALMDRPVGFSTYAHAGTDLYRDQSFLRRKLQRASAIFAVCEFNRQWITAAYPEVAPRVRVHHLGLDLSQYAFDPAARVGKSILAVGALQPPKGFHVLVDACALLRERGVEFRCEIVGEGPERATLEQRIKRLGLEELVFLPGQQSLTEVLKRMRTAALLVHPSVGLGDAVPTVIKEAAAVGTPVVASRVVGIPELVIDGVTGMLVPDNDPSALADAIASMLGNPERARRLAEAARKYAERMFDLRSTGRQLADMLRELATSSNKTD